MRPGHEAIVAEIVRIGDLRHAPLARLLHPVGDAVLAGVGFRLFLRLEAQAQLLLHVGGGRVAHQRLDRARLLRLEFQHPVMGLAAPRLRCRLRRGIDACDHRAVPLLRLPCVLLRHSDRRTCSLAAARSLRVPYPVGYSLVRRAKSTRQNACPLAFSRRHRRRAARHGHPCFSLDAPPQARYTAEILQVGV